MPKKSQDPLICPGCGKRSSIIACGDRWCPDCNDTFGNVRRRMEENHDPSS